MERWTRLARDAAVVVPTVAAVLAVVFIYALTTRRGCPAYPSWDPWSCFEYWFDRYQTMVGALAAVGSAIYAGYWIRRQISAGRAIADRDFERQSFYEYQTEMERMNSAFAIVLTQLELAANCVRRGMVRQAEDYGRAITNGSQFPLVLAYLAPNTRTEVARICFNLTNLSVLQPPITTEEIDANWESVRADGMRNARMKAANFARRFGRRLEDLLPGEFGIEPDDAQPNTEETRA